ncbi:MAG: hypothetical protein Q8M33_14140, partial [Hydrogenophaga sp.]|nr:hypothetical protein [Hydrogenophaga sp.]
MGLTHDLLEAIGHIRQTDDKILKIWRRKRLSGLWCQAPTHKGQQLTLVMVKNKQFFGQHRLVIQHINQKAQGTQIVAKLLESARLTGQIFVNLGIQHLIYCGPH